MRTFLMLCLVALITGCDNTRKENEANERKQREATLKAENSTDTISELPLNFNFGMTSEQVDSNLSKLASDSIITKSGNYYQYVYKLKSGKNIPTDIQFGFYQDSLYALVFSFNENPFSDSPFKVNESLIEEIDTDLSSNLDSTYCRISHYDDRKGSNSKGRMIFTKWFKGNQYIFLRHAAFSDIQYINAPIHRIVTDKEVSKITQRAREKGSVKVGNSSLDGSVSQVKKYIKNNLKDPKSYESIEWGKVVENEDGYMVRHKYRAKNSFGGYTIENKVFHLDLKGNIIDVTNYQ